VRVLVVDLADIPIKELPETIGELISLGHFNFNKTKLETLPNRREY